MEQEIEKRYNGIIDYDDEGNVTLTFDKNINIVTNGDFIVTAKGEVSVLSRTAISLDCALLLLNCRLAKQIREMQHELRIQFLDMFEGMPSLTDEQKKYFKVTKDKACKLLSLDPEEVSHLE